jgi:SAM-dependent methyltransferase
MSSENAAYYDEYWAPHGSWSPSGGDVTEEERHLFSKHLQTGKTCLDYGCGNAERYGAKLTEMGVDYRGFDISETAVASAQSRGVNALQLTPEGRTSLPDSSCDAAVCFEVLEHLIDPLRALAEILRVLKPGGVAMLSVPNAGYWTTRLEFLLTGYLNPGGSPLTARVSPWIDPHIRFFSPALFARMLTAAGFRIVGTSAAPFTLTAVPFLYRKVEWHPTLAMLSTPLAFLGTSFPGLFSPRIFLEAAKPTA